MFYMLDYILITSPTFYDKLQHEQHIVRNLVNCAHMIGDFYEIPINIILRMGSIFNERALQASQFAEELFQVLNKSKTQHLKANADRELLKRFNESILVRISKDQIYDHNRYSIPYMSRVG